MSQKRRSKESAWEGELAKSIRGYRPGDGSAARRREYRRLVMRGQGEAWVSESEAQLLGEALDALVRWLGPDPLAAGEAFQSWSAIYSPEGSNRLPLPVLEALLARYPTNGGDEDTWAGGALSIPEPSLVEVLVSRRLLQGKALKRLAAGEPDAFYRSPLPDVLIRRGLSVPSSIWRAYSQGLDRPSGLMPAGEAVVRSFDSEMTASANKWFVTLLVEAPSVRADVLACLMRFPQAACRLVCHLCAELLSSNKKRRLKIGAQTEPLLSDLITACEASMIAEAHPSEAALTIMGILGSLASSSVGVLPKGVSERVAGASARTGPDLVLRCMKASESMTAESVPCKGLWVETNHLYETVQRYLESLPTGASSGDAAPERRLRHAQYVARREVLAGLVSSLDVTSETRLEDAVRAVLHNAGVLEFGEPTEEVVFDVHLHESLSPGLTPGDRVAIVRPGHMIGSGEDAVVLRAAEVVRSDQ